MLTQEGADVARRWMDLVPEALRRRVILDEELKAGSDAPQLVVRIDGIPFPLAPTHWGLPLAEGETDRQAALRALDAIVQGHAPEYWRTTQDPLIHALGWLDRRIGRRSWRLADERAGGEPSTLERQFRIIREFPDPPAEPMRAQQAARV